MKATFIYSLLAIAITTSAQAAISRFDCSSGTIVPRFENTIGGCCESFNSIGNGQNCVRAHAILDGAQATFICNDSNLDPGLPACCHVLPTPGIDPENLACVASS